VGVLAEIFSDALHVIGMGEVKHPVFYNAPIGIRFEIGGNESVYLNSGNSDECTVNQAYIFASLNRAKTIYENLPHSPNILRIDRYLEDENTVQDIISSVCKVTEMPLPHEQTLVPFQWDEDDEIILQLQLYWDLKRIVFSPDKLLKEIIKADIGGHSMLVSNVYFMNAYDFVLFHLYDDRGADLVAADKDLLRPIFERFNKWILDYDREQINKTFAK